MKKSRSKLSQTRNRQYRVHLQPIGMQGLAVEQTTIEFGQFADNREAEAVIRQGLIKPRTPSPRA
jgi:hypothetical protein